MKKLLLLLSMILFISINSIASENIAETVRLLGTAGVSGLVAYKSTQDLFEVEKFYENLKHLREVHKLQASDDAMHSAYEYYKIADMLAIGSLIMLVADLKRNEQTTTLHTLYAGLSVPFYLAGNKYFQHAKDLADKAPSINDIEAALTDNNNLGNEDEIAMINLALNPKVD